MPKPTLNDVVRILDPMLSDNFALYFPVLPDGIESYINFTQGEGGGGQQGSTAPLNSQEALTIQCRTASKPGSSIEPVAVELFGHNVQYAGRLTYSHTMSVEYVEDRRAIITRTLEGWQQLCRTVLTQHGNYKKSAGAAAGLDNLTSTQGYAVDAELYCYDQAGAQTALFYLHNVWPSEVPDLSFDGSGANLITMSVTFTYDYFSMRNDLNQMSGGFFSQ